MYLCTNHKHYLMKLNKYSYVRIITLKIRNFNRTINGQVYNFALDARTLTWQEKNNFQPFILSF